MCRTVLDVDARTGSYEPTTCALATEPSLRIITQRPPGSAPCIQGVAEWLPLRDKCIEGSLASLTIHHWSDASAGLHELCRVTRERIVLFTLDPEVDTNLWLASDYLPEVLELDRPRFPTLEELEGILGNLRVQSVPIPQDCRDGFIRANWKHPAT